jgi:hypothetical protein
MERPSRAFRDGLRRELPAWRADGLVTEDAARAIAARYRLGTAEPPGGVSAAGIARALAGAALVVGLVWGIVGTGLDQRAPGAALALGWAFAALVGAAAWRFACPALAVEAALGAALATNLALAGAPRLGQATPLALASIAAACAAAPLAARRSALARVVAALRVAGRALFYLAAATLSFSSVADAARLTRPSAMVAAAVLPWIVVASIAVAAGLRRAEVDPLARGEAMLLAATALALGIGHLLETGTGTALVANLALGFLAIGRLVRGVSLRERAPFWEGAAAGAGVLALRALEVHAPGWLHAVALVVVAGLLGAAGAAFERHRAAASAAAPIRG